MKTANAIKLAGAALLIAASLHADVTLVVTGGNASRSVIYDRTAAILSGATVVNGPNSNIKSYKNGTLTGHAALGHVTIHYVLNGAAQGLIDVQNQNNVATTSGNLTAQAAVSGTYPETVGIDSSIFASQRTLVVPFVFIKNPSLANSLHGVTNLTQRQISYLEASSGALPTAFFGGESDTDILYLIGRNTGAAVRQVIDANIYFTGTPSFWTTNTSPNPALPPIPDPLGGHSSAQAVTNDLNIIPNAIATVGSGDVGPYTTLSYEGVPFSSANVANGAYPIWGFEAYYYKNSGAGQPSADQLTVLNALLTAITDNTYQHTSGNAFDAAKFVPLGDLQVDRSADGGPITSIIY